MVSGQEIRDRDIRKLQKLLLILYRNCCSFIQGLFGLFVEQGILLMETVADRMPMVDFIISVAICGTLRYKTTIAKHRLY